LYTYSSRFPALNNFSTALFSAAGFTAAVIGFASQKALSNIISGIFILIFKPFRVEDIIEINSENKGTVEEVTTLILIKQLELFRKKLKSIHFLQTTEAMKK
jgi:small-conductance mechanosensitive channel